MRRGGRGQWTGHTRDPEAPIMEIRDVHALLGRTAYAADGDRLGTVSGAYLDSETGRPSWITVERGGLFRGTTRTFVPVDEAEPVADGVRVPVDADTVKRAPHVDDDRVLTRADERLLRGHYGLAEPAAREPAPTPTGPETSTATETETGTMIRSEEQPRVATATVPTSRAVLRTTRVVEERTFTVPLGRDQVQVVYEPLPDTGPDTGLAAGSERGPEAGAEPGPNDDDGWVVLYEERLVVRTEWVPVERVRLGTVGVRSEQAVQVDLRRERIDVDVDRPADGPTADVPRGLDS
jgi:stress response protein YsnF